MHQPQARKIWMLLPVFGAFAFIVLYLVATCLYPGGSQADVHSKGFSWLHNYWCNLLYETAINGETNTGRPIAIAAAIVLSISLFSFWTTAAFVLQFTPGVKWMLLASGFACIILLPFLPTPYHDTIINTAGFFGLIAMAGIYTGIYKKGWYLLFLFGMVNLLLVAVNNYLYYTKGMIYYLPLVQKITFLSCLLWICFADVKLYRQWKTTAQ